MAKKASKKQEERATEAKTDRKEQELSEEQLEQVAGGAANYLLQIGGIPGETQPQGGNQGPTESVTLNFTKIEVKYTKQ
jgi:hypothetical protein